MFHKITTALFFFTISLGFSQSEIEKIQALFWGEHDIFDKVTEIPEHLKNESAVIIYKIENYDFHKFGKKVKYTTSLRKRVKLLDKASVEEFSEFFYEKKFYTGKGRMTWSKKGKNTVGIKIIKPDGRETIIDTEKDVVEVDGQTKIAISSLEKGDIIDYFFYREEPFKSARAFGFDPVEKTLGDKYPIMDYKLFFETENDFFINFNSYNGAPDLEEISSNKLNTRRYKLTESNIPKGEYIRWFYPLTEKPCYKFQVYFARSGKFEDRALAFLPEDESIIKKKVSQQEVLDLYDNRFRPDGDVTDVSQFFKGKTFESDAHKVTTAYYYMRHFYLTRFVEAFYAKDMNIETYPFMVYGNNVVFIQNQKQFIRHFTEFLRVQNINYEIVVGKKRYDGNLKDLLIESNIEVFIRVETEKPLYASFFGPHTTINEFNPLMEGTDIYLLSSTNTRIDKVSSGTLPASSYRDNETKKNITMTIEPDFSGFNLKVINGFKGHEKSEQQYERLLFSDYTLEDHQKYKTERWSELFRSRKKREKYIRELDALDEKLRKKQKERFKENAKSEYFVDEIEDYNYQIGATGRFSLDSYFSFTESFKTKNALIKKAGPNYIIEIGKLIGGQIEISKKERVRTENIYLPYPRSYNYTIILNIPKGYNVTGLEKLTKSVDNETGAFISSAKIIDDQLIVTTSKHYKSFYEPNSNWSKMIAFLDEAKQFTNEKVLLKKQSDKF